MPAPSQATDRERDRDGSYLNRSLKTGPSTCSTQARLHRTKVSGPGTEFDPTLERQSFLPVVALPKLPSKARRKCRDAEHCHWRLADSPPATAMRATQRSAIRDRTPCMGDMLELGLEPRHGNGPGHEVIAAFWLGSERADDIARDIHSRTCSEVSGCRDLGWSDLGAHSAWADVGGHPFTPFTQPSTHIDTTSLD